MFLAIIISESKRRKKDDDEILNLLPANLKLADEQISYNGGVAKIKICFFPFQLLMDPLVLSVLYVWCQVNKDMIVQFWFGMQFKVGLP